jgi:nicotinic acid mononucleotide adenylyltransferase
MKQYRQFLKEMPAKTIVFAFGRFSPPTTGHGLLIKVVKKFASSNKADYVIYASRTQDKKKNPLSVDKKIHYLNLMFPHTNFKPATDTERTPIEVAKALNSKYKNLVMIAGSDRVGAFEKLLNQYNGIEYNYDSIQVISAGERDPDADDASGMSGTKMRSAASEGDYQIFKKGLPSTLRDIDGKLLMNDVRQGMGLDIIKEQFKLNVDELRERYYNKEIFNIGDIVESNNEPFEILDRGSNYLVVVNSIGETSKKWIQDVVMSEQTLFEDIQPGDVPSEITFKGYTTKNLHHSEDAIRAFVQTIKISGDHDPISVLNALKATDIYMGINDRHLEQGKVPDEQELNQWEDAHIKAKIALERNGDFLHHLDYWHMHGTEIELMINQFRASTANGMTEELTDKTLKTNDKLKVARMIATILGFDDAEKSSNAETLVNNALRKTKTLNKDSLKIVSKMLKLADEVGINYDKKSIKNISKSNLTEEQFQLATERAERYGRRFPNPIDNFWINEVKINKTIKSLPKDDAEKIENLAATGHATLSTKRHGVDQSERTHVGSNLTPGPKGTDTIDRMKVRYMYEELELDEDFDLTEEEIDEIIDSLSEEDIFEAYDDDEFIIIDEEGNEVEIQVPVSEEALMEVLSKMERMKARLRMAKYTPKLTAKRKIAMRTHSDSKKINKRARKLAVGLIKKKLLKGRDPASLSTSERERIERVIEKRKPIINRLAMKLTSKVRKTEKDRLSHH